MEQWNTWSFFKEYQIDRPFHGSGTFGGMAKNGGTVGGFLMGSILEIFGLDQEIPGKDERVVPSFVERDDSPKWRAAVEPQGHEKKTDKEKVPIPIWSE